ncbi:MAG: hypothetical protein WC004_02825 [Candidatus Absconditabacterales bacterium]
MNTIYSPKTTFQITFLVLQTLLCEQAICQSIDNRHSLLDHRKLYTRDVGNNINYPPSNLLLVRDLLDQIEYSVANSDNPPSNFEAIQTFSQQVDAQIASTFLIKESLYTSILQGGTSERIVRDLRTYSDSLYESGAAYNHLHQLTFSYIENKQDGIPKDTIYALVAYQQQIYQKVKNLFTGSYRFWVQQYENPYYTMTFEEFLSRLPEYKGHNGYSFDASNDIEDPANSFYLNQYNLCYNSIQSVAKQAQEAILVLRIIEDAYVKSNDEMRLLSELKDFKHKSLDPIYRELNIALALYNKMSQDQIFHYVRLQNTTDNASVAKVLDQEIQSIGCIEKDYTRQQTQGPCDVLFEIYNKLIMLSQTTDGVKR